MIKANDITRKSWIKYDANSDFPIQNIPFGVFKSNEYKKIQVGTRIGDTVINLSKLEELHYFDQTMLKKGTFENEKTLNLFLQQEKKVWRSIRDKIAELFDEKNLELQKKIKYDVFLESHMDSEQILFSINNVELIMPIDVGDYTDFYSSKDHAMNVGKMFRDPENALLPNWLHLPVGYHGRSSSIVISGTSVAPEPIVQLLPISHRALIVELGEMVV